MLIKIRQGDLELRSCGEALLTDAVEHTTAEIVRRVCSGGIEYCYVLAYWKRDKEGYYLKYVGNRPFEDGISYTTFHYLAKYGQKELDNYFEETDRF
jgi:hypothetical protein